jgi:pilus assembly protein Flp/PilA
MKDAEEAAQQLEVAMQALKRFLKSKDGPTAVEYAVMLALIIVVCLTAISALGLNANTTFGQVNSSM